jgi:hypothetical protein
MLHSVKLPLLSLVALLLAHLTIAQMVPLSEQSTRYNNAIGIGLGTHLGYLNDANYSPLNYRETGFLISIFYERQCRNGKHLLTARVDYGTGTLRTDASTYFSTSSYEGNIEGSMMFHLNPSEQKRFRIYLGPQVNFFGYYMRWGEVDRDAWNYFATQALCIKGLVDFHVSEKSRLRSSFAVPLIGNLVRPPYNGFDQYIAEHREDVVMLAFKGDFASVSDYIGVDWRTRYAYTLSDHLTFQAEYLFRFQQVTETNRLVRFQNQFSGGVVVKF